MIKDIQFNSEARDALKRGIDALANAVKVTLGPKGRNVVIDRQFGTPVVTKDGVSVAKEIFLKDSMENMGAQMVKEVASRTADVAGDGTTTATVLAQALITEGMKSIAAGANPIDVKRGMDKAVDCIVKELKELSQEVGSSSSKIEQVATISANNDPSIGKLIAEAMKTVGNEGVITVEPAKGMDTTVSTVKGLQFDNGYLSPYFVNNPKKMIAELDNPYILIYDKKISSMKELLPVLEQVAQTGKPLLIIAEDVDGEALATLVVNSTRGALNISAVKAPAFGDLRKEMLQDIAVLTGGKVITEEEGRLLNTTTIADLGVSEKITISKDKTTIVGGQGVKGDIEQRVAQIKGQVGDTTDDFDKQMLKQRLAKLTGGVAVLHVGAATEVEMKEKKDRVDDALAATRAAVEEGIVPGGGTAYIRATSEEPMPSSNNDEKIGGEIVLKAIEAPLRQIASNAGVDSSDIIDTIRSSKGGFGYNAKDEKFEDLYTAGIIDPTKVSRVALENAVSVAGMVLITECVISDTIVNG